MSDQLIKLQNEIENLQNQVEQLYERLDSALDDYFESDCDCGNDSFPPPLEGVDLWYLAFLLDDIGIKPHRKYSEGERLEMRERLQGVVS